MQTSTRPSAKSFILLLFNELCEWNLARFLGQGFAPCMVRWFNSGSDCYHAHTADTSRLPIPPPRICRLWLMPPMSCACCGLLYRHTLLATPEDRIFMSFPSHWLLGQGFAPCMRGTSHSRCVYLFRHRGTIYKWKGGKHCEAVINLALSWIMTAPTGFEPVNNGVKVRCLTTWRRG